MKKVLISIHPKWCELIFNGQKTIEVCRSFPKQLETPFEVLVYLPKKDCPVNIGCGGTVIGSFVCDKVYKIVPDGEYYSNGYDIDDDMLSEMCLGRGYLTGYGLGYTIYGWHITSPKLFDKPRELGEFRKVCLNGKCSDCIYEECKITRPPQSWCYVEELQ